MRQAALRALCIDDPRRKVVAVRALVAADPEPDPERELAEPAHLPGRPSRPPLVPPSQVPARPVGTGEGRAALLHALAHIEFNAINLALDAVWRFARLPAAYYRDWLRVAGEEAHHFELLCGRLAALGHAYGDFPAHDGLWEAARATREDALARMAVVPRILEARGLDASPQIRRRLVGAGDLESAAVIDVILRDEIGHVAIGNRWFYYLCRESDSDPVVTGRALAARFGLPPGRPPFNLQARRAAGFRAEELAALSGGR